MRLITILFTFTVSLFAVSKEQLTVLQTVRDVARSIPDHSGETYENTLSAICLTESSAGKNLIGDFKKGVVITKASLGVLQIQVATARFISTRVDELAWLNELSDAKLANKLLSDIELSARIAAHYLVILYKARGEYFKMVSGYNGGMTNHPYYARVMKNMKLVKKLVADGRIS
ncbi:MAG: transglycosylase SLT domain-containing protein [Campylobacterota bacterium]|nr:transglycosylase SLT domain-containing protein [Campylobacterota bacterium]